MAGWFFNNGKRIDMPEKVISQIKKDIQTGDFTAIEEMLKQLLVLNNKKVNHILFSFLSEV